VWNHWVILVKNTAGLEHFLNLSSIFSTAGTVNVAQTINTTYIGKYRPQNVQHFSGQLDDIRIYNRALSANEIRLLAARRGIAYELAPRKRIYSIPAVPGGFQPYWATQRSQMIGGGVR
jgi:hypothetical protein